MAANTKPIWSKVGDPIDVAAHAGSPPEYATLKTLTAEVMQELTGLVEDLRARYPRRWSDG